jgi:hypothetical protein
MPEAKRIGWTQPLCLTCFAAWEVGNGRVPREPHRVVGDGDPCLICGADTGIYVRIDPAIAGVFANAKEKE